MIRTFLLFASLVGYVASATAQVTIAPPPEHVNLPPLIMHCPGNAPFLWHYQPEEVKTLIELPASVAENIKAYLSARVGKYFFETLSFAGGQKVNLSKEDSTKLGVSGYHWKLATYYARFNCLSLQKPDGSYFEAGASFDAQGNVVDSVNLPPLAIKKRSTIISSKEAVRIGRANWNAQGGSTWINKKTVYLDYSPLNQTFVWWFSKTTSEAEIKGLAGSRFRRIFIEATTGQVLKVRDNKHRYVPF